MVRLAHKAFLRGILIKFRAQERKRQSNEIDSLLRQIKFLEQTNKALPNQITTNELKLQRYKLGEILHRRFDYYVKRLKLQSYPLSNKSGTFLAKQVKKQQIRLKIPFLLNP